MKYDIIVTTLQIDKDILFVLKYNMLNKHMFGRSREKKEDFAVFVVFFCLFLLITFLDIGLLLRLFAQTLLPATPQTGKIYNSVKLP